MDLRSVLKYVNLLSPQFVDLADAINADVMRQLLVYIVVLSEDLSKFSLD